MIGPSNLSLIVCTHNRARLLMRALNSITRQQTERSVNWEAVVVDNNSTDDTARVVREAAERCANIRYVFEATQGLSHARNRGIREAQGELLCFVDDDVLLPPDYIANAVTAWKAGTWDLAGGRVLPEYERTIPSWVRRLGHKAEGILSLYDRGESDFILEHQGERLAIGANMLIARSLFDQIGYFDVALGRAGRGLQAGEDTEFFLRAKRSGMTIGYAGSCSVRHMVPRSRLTRRYFVQCTYMSACVAHPETLPSDTVFWFRVPRYCWRSLFEAILRFFLALPTRRRFERLLTAVYRLGEVSGYLTRRRPYRLADTDEGAER